MECLLYAMHDDPPVVDALLTHVVDYYVGASARVFEAAAGAIDIFFIGNDFGSQRGPLISRTAFHRFLVPHLERLCRLGHEHHLKVMMHCCGNYAAIIPDMIAAGIDGLQAVQPCGRGMEPERLKEAYGRQMLFNGCIDSHHVLMEGTPDLVRTRTAEVMNIMKPGGGYVLSASHDYILDQTPVENVLAMFDVAREYE
jgi:uroporphyrinogen decarboxylase